MLVVGTQLVQFNRLRAVFPQRIKPPFAYTDYVGEYASAGLPRVDPTTGNIYSGGDSLAFSDSALGGMEFNPVLGVVYPRPMPLPQNNYWEDVNSNSYYVDYENPNTNWPGYPKTLWNAPVFFHPSTGVTYTVPPSGRTAQGVTGGGTTVYVQNSGSGVSVASTVTCIGNLHNASKCQGFTGLFAPPAAATVNPNNSIGVTTHMTAYTNAGISWRVMGSSNPTRWYRLIYIVGLEYQFLYNDSVDSSGNPIDSGWVIVDKIKPGGQSGSLLMPQTGTLYSFQVLLLAGQLQITIESVQTPFVYPLRGADDWGNFDWYIDRFQYSARGTGIWQWAVFPLKFRKTASVISNEINVGQAMDSEQFAGIKYLTHYAPSAAKHTHDAHSVGFLPTGSTTSAATFDVSGTTLRYKLSITNTKTGTYRNIDFSDTTAVVRAVSLDVPPRDWFLINPPTILGGPAIPPLPPPPPKPSAINISHRFNLQTLSIESQAQMRFDNFKGKWTNGYGTGYLDEVGHFAVGIDLGIEAYGTLNREFTGIGNTDFSNDWGGGGRDDVVVSCADCWLFLDVPVWNLPWFDGWNVYKVMYFLGSLGGLTDDQMLFLPYVPDSPFDKSPGLPDEQQYFMPEGASGAPLTRFGGGQKIKQIMLKIACSIGFTLFFNVYGGLNFYKFQLPSVTPFTHYFSHVAGDALDPTQPGLGEIWTGSYRGSLRDVRNSVTVIGINALGPMWNPIVAHETDLDSVFNDSVINFKGFHDPMVWTDSQFSNVDYAGSAAFAMLSYLRLPAREVTFTTWYRGGIPVYPGEMIRILYPRSGASLFSFFVTGTQASHVNGQNPSLNIQARLVPNFNSLF